LSSEKSPVGSISAQFQRHTLALHTIRLLILLSPNSHLFTRLKLLPFAAFPSSHLAINHAQISSTLLCVLALHLGASFGQLGEQIASKKERKRREKEKKKKKKEKKLSSSFSVSLTKTEN